MQCISAYSSFFYIAFVEKYLGLCKEDECMRSLATNLGIIFGVQLVVNPLTDILSTFLKYKIRINSSSELYNHRKSPIVEDYFLVPVSYIRIRCTCLFLML